MVTGTNVSCFRHTATGGSSMKRLMAVLLVALVAVLAFAQTETARVSGRVTDQTGAVIVGAECKITNIETNTSFKTATNEEGIYLLPNLKPGTYRLSITKQGFSTVIKPNLEIHVQDAINENFSLGVGSTSESVTVKGGAPLVNTQSATVGTSVDPEFVGNMPLNGRSFQSLIRPTPGVTVASASPFDNGQCSVNGQRSSTNYFVVDGVSANIGLVANSGGSANAALAGSYPGLTAFGGTNNLVSVDALEEFKIQTSTYSAEYGRQPGGQVSLVTRSGNNNFHGTLFEYLRNDALDARDYFNRTCAGSVCTPTKKPALRQNQFGGTF